jgi:hypothetical protein
VIRIAALKAAKDAADHMVKNHTTKTPNSVGAFALYTWGSLALVSAAYVAVVGINLDSLTFQLPQSPQLARVEAPAKPKVLQVPAVVEVQVPNAPEVAKIETPKNTLMENKIKADLPSELSELPAPLAPKVELPKDHLAVFEADPQIDELRTGSVNAFSEEDLQPFPEDVLPEDLFAVDIGGGKAVAPLIGRYSALKRRAPDLFSGLEPRIQLKGANSTLEARLVAGPFTSKNQVARFCRSLRLRLTVDCTMSSFEGDTIQ